MLVFLITFLLHQLSFFYHGHPRTLSMSYAETELCNTTAQAQL